MIDHNPREMVPAIWVEVVIFISSYYPLFLILMIRDISAETEGVPFGFLSWGLNVSYTALIFFVISSFANLLACCQLRAALIHQEGGTPVKVLDVEQVRGDMLNYTLPFLIGLFAFDYETWQSKVSLIVFLFFIFSFIHKERLSLLNPMFLLMGIKLYRVKYKEVGRDNEKVSNVLCLGCVDVSDDVVEVKETVGINFIFNRRVLGGGDD